MEIIYTQPDCPPASVTIFAIPKPFAGHIGLIQHNAIASWTKLRPRPEIFLYGNEQGTKEICQELGLIYVDQIKRNEYGTPLLDGVFAQTCDRSKNKIIAYLNADIILTDDFITGVGSCDRQLEDYLLIGRRWDIDLDKQLCFTEDWQSNLTEVIRQNGCLADIDCKDYFVFPKHLFTKIPAFAVGRGYWDTWMVNYALDHNYPVVDCSLAITAVHQNHPYIHIKGGRSEAYMGREAQLNKSLGNVTQPGNIACSTWQLKPDKYQRSPLISVIIIAQDNEREIEKTVLSLLVQDYDDCEIIVIDWQNRKSTRTALQAYQTQIKYYFLAAAGDRDAHLYGLAKASGELILYLSANNVLLPKTLDRLVNRFTQEASTLDILLAGYRQRTKEVREYFPWKDFPDSEKLASIPADKIESLLGKSVIIFRAARTKSYLENYSTSSESKITKIISSLIRIRGCRTIWFEEIVVNRYV